MQTSSSTASHAFSPDSLINQETGELDLIAIRARAAVLAARDFGAPNYPPAYFRSREQNVIELARIMRKRWRRVHGLPDDTPCEMVAVPVWGDSGDSFTTARGGA